MRTLPLGAKPLPCAAAWSLRNAAARGWGQATKGDGGKAWAPFFDAATTAGASDVFFAGPAEAEGGGLFFAPALLSPAPALPPLGLKRDFVAVSEIFFLSGLFSERSEKIILIPTYYNFYL